MVEELSAQENSVVLMLLFATIFLTLVTLGLILFFYFSRKKVIQKEREKAELKIANQQKILETSIAIQELERKRIAQDLHDAISSKLNIVSLSTNVLLSDKKTTNKQKKTLEQILEITSTTLESSRKIAHDLLPPILDKFGLKAALEELFEDYCKNTQIDIQYDLEELEISKEKQLHLFRILQELVNNSIRHGKADELVVFLEENDNGYKLRYQDNGLGFDVEAVKKKAGIGMQNIMSRARILNGKFHYDSQIGKGSTFVIRSNYEKTH
ncbi:histidine kinase/DNA gyrase B/HSP90-like ATPase [Winogradskyella wandonensis]|uniref:histidine kinase n=1 Tax=Winogradskyella wandonensis TaxID=1442586 RepID=A0A4R1KRI5_9FLAO|nr:sensor histidine kinase [Winogradskyella wandonensis]TCK67634.1 histidine kinase/DNA gyrase B/HSP90-like ATPase [Winogradskyella wandonensis]